MNQFYRSEANKINLNALNRELKKLFENTRKHQTLPSSQTSSYCKPEHLAAFFQNHFDEKTKKQVTAPAQIISSPNCISLLTMDNNSHDDTLTNEDPPILQEIQSIFRNLKSNQSSTDILKCLANSKAALRKFEVLYSKLWRSERVPHHFEHSRVAAIWKKKGKNQNQKITGAFKLAA